MATATTERLESVQDIDGLLLRQMGFPSLHPAQARIDAALARFNVLNCGRRTGKTEYGMQLAARAALAGQPVAWLSPTYRMLREVYRELERRLHPVLDRAAASEERLELASGGIIDFWAMDLGGADRIRGRRYARAILDECALVVALSRSWEMAIRPTLVDLRGDAYFLSTPRRGSGFEELYRRGERGEPGWRSWTLTSFANPHIPPEEIEAARAGMSEQAFAQEFLAEFEASESDLVHPEFDRLLHVRPPTASWAECKLRVVGIDPGGGDPTAIVPMGISPLEHVHQYGEFYRRGDVSSESISEYLGRVEAGGHIHALAVGETGGNILVNTLRGMGWPAFKADMGRGQGIEIVRMLLQRGRLTIGPECHNSIAEFASYRWAKRRDQETGDRYATSAAADHHADAMDARRYAVVALIRGLGRQASAGPREVVIR